MKIFDPVKYRSVYKDRPRGLPTGYQVDIVSPPLLIRSPLTPQKMYRPTTKNEWWFCGTLLMQAVLVIGLEMSV